MSEKSVAQELKKSSRLRTTSANEAETICVTEAYAGESGEFRFRVSYVEKNTAATNPKN